MDEKGTSKSVGLVSVGASEGAVVGPAFVYATGKLEPERKSISEGEVEDGLERFQGAVEAVAEKRSEARDRLEESAGEEEAAIFDAHVELAQDPEFSSGVEECVRNLMSSPAAVLAAGEEYAEMFAGMDDEYMAAREAGIWVGVCGEAAGEPDLIPKLVELGVTKLSVSTPSIPRGKKVVSEL